MERNGDPFPGAAQVAPAQDEDEGDQLLLPNLPIGRYRVRLDSDGQWQAPERSFSVTSRTPAELTLPALGISASHR